MNNHRTLRQMLGHGMMDDDITYPLQTLKDNVRLLTPDILDKINTVVKVINLMKNWTMS